MILIFLNNSFRNVTSYSARAGTDEILIHRLTDTENFEFYDVVKAFTLLSDQWIRLEKEVLPENHIIVLDIEQITLKIVAKANIFLLQKFIVFLLVSIFFKISL